KRGFHLKTREIAMALPEIKNANAGLLHIFIQHTSASLAINENADPDVRWDMESFFSQIVPADEPYFKHTIEGSDDMPAHLKNVILGCQTTIPIGQGRLLLGTWQGLYLCEHRDRADARNLILTVTGETLDDTRELK
ncbi:MAG: secondary thiamine-phosphate synthase enzyme YjbQ, partial [Gammaproteobacteria bacterium]